MIRVVKLAPHVILVLLLAAFSITGLNAQGVSKVQHKGPKTSNWSFTEQDFKELSKEQLEIVKKSYWIGKSYNLGTTLAAISIVETRAGAFPDKSRNRICGAHQVDVRVAKENLGTETSPKRLCKALQDNPVLSAIVSLEILMYWRDNTKSYKEMLNSYNRGWQESPYDDEYYRRIQMTLKVLNKNNIESL